MNDNQPKKAIQHLIYTIHDMQVMLDSDLAELYGIEMRRPNEQIKHNADHFPKEYKFQLDAEE